MKFSVIDVLRTLPQSHPARGAWIEMCVLFNLACNAPVAPRKGCVD